MFFVICVDPETGHKFAEVADNIDEAKFIKDRLDDIGFDEIYITKEVNIGEEEEKYYASLPTVEMVDISTK